MAKHKTSFTIPNPIAPQRYANNGLTPSPLLYTRVANGLNYIAGVQRKSLFLKSNFLEAPSSVTTGDVWYGYFTTGHTTEAITFNFGLIPIAAPTSSTHIQLVIFDDSGSTVQSVNIGYRGGGGSGGQVYPDDIKHMSRKITGLDPDTSYAWEVNTVAACTLAYMSVAELVVTEVDDATDGVTNPGAFVDGGPIYDSHIGDLQESAKELWRHSGSHLLSWCMDYGTASANTIASSTWTNMVDGSSTSVSGSSKGFYLATDYKSTASRTSVPVVCAFKVGISGTANLDVRLTDGTNSISATGITSTPTAEGWTLATGTIPDTGAQWDLQARRNSGSGTCTIYAVSLWEYES